jgi:predicted secreted protein
MSKVVYEIVEHDGGWAYKVGATFSETFSSHYAARAAAERAAREQQVAGDTVGISYEDSQGRWRDEIASGGDRPSTEVDG